MPRGVYERKKQSGKRKQILLAARKMYHQDGLVDTTIEQIAGEAGVSRSLISQLFGGKTELVKAIAEQALDENLQAIREIDATPGLTLRQRENMIHDLMGQNLEDWRLILRTSFVPALQFMDQEELRQANLRMILEHLDELREQTEEAACIFAETVVGLHMGYVIDAQDEQYQDAFERCMDHCLLAGDRA